MKETESSKLILNEGAKYNMSLVFSRSQYMNKSNYLANITTVMQQKSEILRNTKSHCMKMLNFLVLIELLKVPQRDQLENLM